MNDQPPQLFKEMFKPKEPSSHKKIKNKNYRSFLDDGEISVIKKDHLELILKTMKHKSIRESRSLMILLYYTGARPNEILRLTAKDITKDGNYIKVQIKGSKKGVSRPLRFPVTLKLVNEVYLYATHFFPDQYLFWSFRKPYKREIMTKKGIVKERSDLDSNIRYWVSKWTKVLPIGTVTPYYFRHNLFSLIAMDGATDRELRQLKGSKTNDSIQPYLHLSKEKSEKMGVAINRATK